ncbi:MAG: hypothetical protein AB1671_22385 [Thermodesulfobacteriota bacterium]|jgi:hypothetical protein
MRNIIGLLIPSAMILLGAYVLFTALSSPGEQVALISDHALPKGLAMVFSLLGLGGGTAVMFSALANRKHTT